MYKLSIGGVVVNSSDSKHEMISFAIGLGDLGIACSVSIEDEAI